MFEDLSKRLSSIAPPLLAHRIIFNLAAKKLEEIKESPSCSDNLKGLFTVILKKFEIEMVWVCQLESLDSVVQTLIEYKGKTNQLHIKNYVISRIK